MKFKVTFRRLGPRAISCDGYYPGLRVLDGIRDKFGPHVTASQVFDAVPALDDEPAIELTEEEARGSGLFQDAATVEVSNSDLSKFTTMEYLHCPEVEHPGACYYVQREIDVDLLKTAWIEAGCPLEWYP